MRNYIGISEFKKQDFINKLKFFDDEYFVVLRNNQPVFLAYQNLIQKEVEGEFSYEFETCSTRDLFMKGIAIEGEKIMHMLENNTLYYSIVPYEREISSFIDKTLLQKVREEHMRNIK